MKHWGISLFLINAALITFEWWTNSGGLFAGNTAGVFLALGRLSGLIAAYTVLWQLLFMSRAPFLEKAFGFDRLTRLHHWNGFVALTAIVAHPILVILSYGMSDKLGFFSEAVQVLTGYEDTLNALIGVILFVALVVLSILIVRKRLKYETWYFVHLSAYLAVLLAFGHQTDLGGDFRDKSLFILYWDLLYVAVFGALIIYRFFTPLFNLYRHKFALARIEPAGPEANSLFIKGNDLSEMKILPGQFFIMRFLAKRFWAEAHPFSVSRLPDGEEMRFTIKSSGDFTRKIKELPSGSKVLLDGPYGSFTPKSASKSKVLLVAAGVGITPVYVLTEYFLKIGKEVTLIYGTAMASTAILKSDIDDLKAKDNLSLHMIVSQEPEYTGLKGRITGELIQRLVPDFKERDVYVCGPKAMMRLLKKDLFARGLDEKLMHAEEFSF